MIYTAYNVITGGINMKKQYFMFHLDDMFKLTKAENLSRVFYDIIEETKCFSLFL